MRRILLLLAAIGLLAGCGGGGGGGHAFTKTQATQGGKTVSVSAKGLGIEGWALHGSFFNPKAPRTYFYTWRIGNAILSFILSGDVTEKQARGYSETLNRRAKDVA